MRRLVGIWIGLLLAGGAIAVQTRPVTADPRPPYVGSPDFCDRGDVCVTVAGAAVIHVP